MLKLTNPRLRRNDVIFNSIASCISDASKEFPRAPEVSVSKMVSKPRMFFEKFKGTVSFKQLKSQTNTHGWRHLNKQVDMVSSYVEFINLEPFSVSHLPQEKLTIHLQPVKLEGVFSIFNFPDKMESILSEAVLPRFEIHFLSPEHSSNYVRLFISGGLVSRPSDSNHLEILNFEDGDSSLSLKAEVSSPWM